jgi:excisionase family DNA binding protein
MPTARRTRSAGIPAQFAPARELLSVPQAAERLGTPERFVRRLIAERRIRFYRVGKYVRFDSQDLDAFVGAGLVEPYGGRAMTDNLPRQQSSI